MRSKLGKIIVSILLVLSMIIPNVAIKANAEETDNPIDNHTIKWVPFVDAAKVQEYLDGNKVPTESEYLFAGWYTQETYDMDSIKQYALRNAQPSGTTYALFVPQDVLGVKAQVSAHLCDGQRTDADNSASIRFVTSVPSLSFSEVGLEVTYIGKDGKTEYTSKSVGNKVYETMYFVGSQDEDTATKPWTLLCGASKYFKAHVIEGVPSTSYTTEFNVKPYWVTLEGDKVYAEPQVKRIADAIVKIDNEGTNGTVSLGTDQGYYLSGDTVTLTGEGVLGRDCIGMTVNGTDYELNENGEYSFVAEPYKQYIVSGIYEKLNNYSGSMAFTHPYTSGTTASLSSTDVVFANAAKDIDISLDTKRHTQVTSSSEKYDVLFEFENGKNVSFYLGVLSGNWSIANLNSADDAKNEGNIIYGRNATVWHKLSDTERSSFMDKTLNFRIVRQGTNVLILLDSNVVATVDLTHNNSGVTAEMTAKVTVKHYGTPNSSNATGDVVGTIPFIVSDAGDIPFTHPYTSGSTASLSTTSVVINNAATDIDLTLETKRHTQVTSGSEKYDVLFEFDNQKNISFYLGIVNGNWSIANLNSAGDSGNTGKIIYNRDTVWHTLSATEKTAFIDNQKLNFRIVRQGTDVKILLDDNLVAIVDLRNNDSGVTAETTAKVTVRHYGQPQTSNAGDVVGKIPFSVSETVHNVTGNMAFTHPYTSGTTASLSTTSVVINHAATDIDLTLETKRHTQVTSGSEKYDVLFEFENQKNISFYLGIVSGNWSIANLNSAGDSGNTGKIIYNRDTVWHKLSDAEKTAFIDNQKLNFRIVRQGTNVLILLDDNLVATVDLRNNDSGVTAETTAKVTVRHYGQPQTSNTGDVVGNIPFSVSEAVDNIAGNMSFTHPYTSGSAASLSTTSVVINNAATDIDLTLETKRHTQVTSGSEKYDVLFEFENQKNISFYLGIVNGNWSIANLNSAGDSGNTGKIIYNRDTVWHKLSDAEKTAFIDNQKLNFRIVRQGTDVKIFLDNNLVATVDLRNNDSGVTAEMTAKVTVRHYGQPQTSNTGDVVGTVPFILSTP